MNLSKVLNTLGAVATAVILVVSLVRRRKEVQVAKIVKRSQRPSFWAWLPGFVISLLAGVFFGRLVGEYLAGSAQVLGWLSLIVGLPSLAISVGTSNLFHSTADDYTGTMQRVAAVIIAPFTLTFGAVVSGFNL